jgi:hypothetical protein
MHPNTFGNTREFDAVPTSSLRELVAEELDAVSGGDGPPGGCIPGSNCIGDSSDFGSDGW